MATEPPQEKALGGGAKTGRSAPVAFDEAIRIVFDIARPLSPETVSLDDADGRVLAAPIVARRTSPSAAVSAMDGYAVIEADLASAPVRLPVIGRAFAGRGFDGLVEPGTCVRIFTGAPVPAGADWIVIQEVVHEDMGFAVFGEPPRGRSHIRRAGADFAAGDRLVETGLVLTPQRLIAGAAADLEAVDVVARPRLSIISAGDELVAPGRASGHGGVPESVSIGVAAMARRWSGEVVSRQRLGDDLPSLEAAAKSAIGLSDVVVVIGGASLGERDFAKAMFEPIGLELLFNKVAMRPGRPVWMGRVGDVVVVGLPGNPAAALVTARLLLAPLLAGMSGLGAATAAEWRKIRLAARLDAGCPDRDTFFQARRVDGGTEPLPSQDSSSQNALALADILIRRPPGSTWAASSSFVDGLEL